MPAGTCGLSNCVPTLQPILSSTPATIVALVYPGDSSFTMTVSFGADTIFAIHLMPAR